MIDQEAELERLWQEEYGRELEKEEINDNISVAHQEHDWDHVDSQEQCEEKDDKKDESLEIVSKEKLNAIDPQQLLLSPEQNKVVGGKKKLILGEDDIEFSSPSEEQKHDWKIWNTDAINEIVLQEERILDDDSMSEASFVDAPVNIFKSNSTSKSSLSSTDINKVETPVALEDHVTWDNIKKDHEKGDMNDIEMEVEVNVWDTVSKQEMIDVDKENKDGNVWEKERVKTKSTALGDDDDENDLDDDSNASEDSFGTFDTRGIEIGAGSSFLNTKRSDAYEMWKR